MWPLHVQWCSHWPFSSSEVISARLAAEGEVLSALAGTTNPSLIGQFRKWDPPDPTPKRQTLRLGLVIALSKVQIFPNPLPSHSGPFLFTQSGAVVQEAQVDYFLWISLLIHISHVLTFESDVYWGGSRSHWNISLHPSQCYLKTEIWSLEKCILRGFHCFVNIIAYPHKPGWHSLLHT